MRTCSVSESMSESTLSKTCRPPRYCTHEGNKVWTCEARKHTGNDTGDSHRGLIEILRVSSSLPPSFSSSSLGRLQTFAGQSWSVVGREFSLNLLSFRCSAHANNFMRIIYESKKTFERVATHACMLWPPKYLHGTQMQRVCEIFPLKPENALDRTISGTSSAAFIRSSRLSYPVT